MKIEIPTYSITLNTIKRRKDNSLPVVLRLTFKGKRKYYATKFSAQANEWDNVRFFKGRNSIDKNHELKQIAAKAQKCITIIKDKGKPFSFELFDRYFTGEPNPLFKSFIEDHIQSLIKMDRLGYASTFKDTFNQIKKYKGDAFRLKDIDVPFLEGFKKHYLEKGNKISSLNIHLITIRTLLNLAIRLQLISQESYPFKEFKIEKCRQKRKIALPESDLITLKDFNPTLNSSEWLAKQYFFASFYLRGINLVDLLELKWSQNIVAGRLIYKRKKTGEEITIKLRQEVLNIFNSFKSDNDFIFPVYSDEISVKTKRARLGNLGKFIRVTLRKISSDLGLKIGKRITYYSARHSYAMTLKRAGNSNEIIKEGLAHADQSTTNVYLDSFENEVLDKADDYLYNLKHEQDQDLFNTQKQVPFIIEEQFKQIAKQILNGISVDDLIKIKANL